VDDSYTDRDGGGCCKVRTTWKAVLATLCVAGAALPLAGCGGGGKTSPATGVQTLAGSVTSSPVGSVAGMPSASTTSPVTSARNGAIAAVRRYYATIDKLYANPRSPLNTVTSISTGDQAAADRSGLLHFRISGWKQSGSQSIVTIQAGATDLTDQPSHRPTPIFPTVRVSTCNDVGKVGGADAKGKSIVAGGRKRYLLNQLTVTNIRYPAAAGWRVSGITNKGASACP